MCQGGCGFILKACDETHPSQMWVTRLGQTQPGWEQWLSLAGVNLVLHFVIIGIEWMFKMVHGSLKENAHPFGRDAQTPGAAPGTPRTLKGVTDGRLPSKVIPRP